MFKIALATIASMLLVASVSQAKNMDESAKLKKFEGDHALVSNKLGLCSPSLDVYINVDYDGTLVDAGGFAFPRINEGAFITEDQNVRSNEQSFTSNNDTVLNFKGTDYDKAQYTTGKTSTVLTLLPNGHLHLRSYTTDGAIYGYNPMITDCTYKSVSTSPNAN